MSMADSDFIGWINTDICENKQRKGKVKVDKELPVLIACRL